MKDNPENGPGELRVRVKYYTTLRDLAGAPEEEMTLWEGAVLNDLIEKVMTVYGREARDYLMQEYGDQRDINRSMYFLINGKNFRTLSGMETPLSDGDKVAIIPPIGGG